MRKFTKCLTWLLILSLCIGMIGLPVFAIDGNLDYFFGYVEPNADNDLFPNSSVTEPLDPATLNSSEGTHYYAGSGNISRYASAHVCRTGEAGEEPVVYDSYGTPYYVQYDHNTLESYGLYVNDYYMDGQHIEGKVYARWDAVQTFVLADARTGKLSTTYCADQITPVEVANGRYYNIENLEDAVYYTPAQAIKVRTVALNGYWGQPQGMGSLAAMEEMLLASGEFTSEELAYLSEGVAMTATQYAIWHFTNNQTGDKRISAYYAEKLYSANMKRPEGEQKKDVDLLFKIYHYLVNLDPSSIENTTANTVITRDNFVTNMGVTNAVLVEGHENNADTNEDNDAYIADVTFTMGVQPKSTAGDDLVAKIVDAEGNVLAIGRIAGTLQEGETQLEGSNGTYTFKGLTLIEGNQKLKVELNGHQELEQGVYLYTHADGYENSQTLVGIAEGTHTVDLEQEWEMKFSVNEPPERIIRINKQNSDGSQALPGIQFDFYFVAGRDEYLAGTKELPENAVDYTDLPALPDYTIITDQNGSGTFNLTENNLPDGVYLVVEREHPAIVQPVDPFYVIIPATNAEGTELVYEIDITPKNDIRGDVKIEKDVIKLNNDLSNENAYDSHTWIISTTIPSDIGSGRSFVISDVLDNRLDFLGNVRVRVENSNGTIVAATLTEGKDYILTVVDNDSLAEGKLADSFTVSLTKAGMEKVASAATAGITNIRVYFDAQINANAQMGEMIPNKARLEYVNSVGVGFTPESDIPEVYTGGARLKKVDANDNTMVLDGAEFKLYRKATQAEIDDESIEKIELDDMDDPMVSVQFFSNPELTGEKSDTAVSGEDGFVYIYGLVNGEYYLVETKAPAGYNLTGDPIKVVINESSHLDEYVIVVENVSGTVLPETGGIGTAVFTVSGMMLMMTAAVLLLQKKRKSI